MRSHGGRGESDNQSNCEKELLHGGSPINPWPVDLAFDRLALVRFE
jgi:hypothetical protein